MVRDRREPRATRSGASSGSHAGLIAARCGGPRPTRPPDRSCIGARRLPRTPPQHLGLDAVTRSECRAAGRGPVMRRIPRLPSSARPSACHAVGAMDASGDVLPGRRAMPHARPRPRLAPWPGDRPAVPRIAGLPSCSASARVGRGRLWSEEVGREPAEIRRWQSAEICFVSRLAGSLAAANWQGRVAGPWGPAARQGIARRSASLGSPGRNLPRPTRGN